MNKVLITGAAGRIGKKLVSKLAQRKDLELLLPSQAEFDLSNLEQIETFIAREKPTIIIHLAAVVGVATTEADKNHSYQINVVATKRLAEVAAQNGVLRFIFASSAAVYGSATKAQTETENSQNPINNYGQEKLAAEHELTQIAETSSLQAICLRIFNVYGPDFPDSLVNKLATSSQENPVQIKDPDNFIRDYIHVDDVIKAFELSLAVADLPAKNTIINIASGVARSTSSMITELTEMGIKPTFEVVSGSAASSIYADVTQATQILNFSVDQKLKLTGIN